MAKAHQLLRTPPPDLDGRGFAAWLRQCGSKEAWRTKKKAVKEAQRLGYRVYLCPYARRQHWHLSSNGWSGGRS